MNDFDLGNNPPPSNKPPASAVNIPPPPAAPPPSLPSVPTVPQEDIFAKVDPPPPPPSAFNAPAPVEPLQELPEMEEDGGRKKIFVVLGTIVALLVILAGAWFAYSQWLSAPKTPEQPVVNEPTNVPVNNSVVTPTTTSSEVDNDYDRDGLTNSEEEQLGTDPYNADTDMDGLYDRDEVKVWHTNPLNSDSDNDGYLDGDEVVNGYNPQGPGKLLQLPTSTNP